MPGVPLRVSYLCAVVALGLLALHFNAEQLSGWTRGLAALGAVLALPGALLAAWSLGRSGWTSARYWRAQIAFALNALLALAFLLYLIA